MIFTDYDNGANDLTVVVESEHAVIVLQTMNTPNTKSQIFKVLNRRLNIR